jgi:hypothetical protein
LMVIKMKGLRCVRIGIEYGKERKRKPETQVQKPDLGHPHPASGKFGARILLMGGSYALC